METLDRQGKLYHICKVSRNLILKQFFHEFQVTLRFICVAFQCMFLSTGPLILLAP